MLSLEEIKEDAPPKAFDPILLAYKPSRGAIRYKSQEFLIRYLRLHIYLVHFYSLLELCLKFGFDVSQQRSQTVATSV